MVCYLAVLAKYKYGYDDSLDAFGIHGVGGLTGALLTGVFAVKRTFPGVADPVGADGLLAGNARQLGIQALACLVTAVYATVLSSVCVSYTPSASERERFVRSEQCDPPCTIFTLIPAGAAL